MQDIESIGGGRRIFGGVADRRLRPQHHQALKCPRCDSLNTKFCYYNNYNLSQPRHFCKGCRRYWTRGGVLRNVPVGGGCRKTKRSSKPKAPSSSTTTVPEQNKSSSNSSSESSSLTAAATAETVSEPKVLIVQNTTSPSLEQALLERSTDYGMFSEMGNLTSLMTNPPTYGLNDAADISQFRMNQEQEKMMGVDGEEDGKIQEMTGGLLDHGELAGFGSLDWASGGGADQGLFDQTYWSHTQCNYQDHPILFLP